MPQLTSTNHPRVLNQQPAPSHRYRDLDLASEHDEAETGRKHWLTVLTAGMGFFTDAYDLFTIGTVTVILTPIFRFNTGLRSTLRSRSRSALPPPCSDIDERGKWLDQEPTVGGHSQFSPGMLKELLVNIGASIDAGGGSFTMRANSTLRVIVRGQPVGSGDGQQNFDAPMLRTAVDLTAYGTGLTFGSSGTNVGDRAGMTRQFSLLVNGFGVGGTGG